MAHNILRLAERLASDVSNPYEPANIDPDAPLGLKDASKDVMGKGIVASLLPGELKSHYLSYDCHKQVKECRVGGGDHECVSCRSLGGGTCVKANAKLRDEYNLEADGVCIPLSESRHFLDGKTETNPFTTVEEAYLHYETIDVDAPSTVIAKGVLGGVSYLTKKRGCVDSSIVRKDPDLLNKNPVLEPYLGCTDIVMCGGRGMGYPLHPQTHKPIYGVDDIDFDIITWAPNMACQCEEGNVEERDPITNIPTCRSEGWGLDKEEGGGCPVVFYTGDSKGCLCDNSTQVRLNDVSKIESVDNTSDYGQGFVDAVKELSEITTRYENLKPYMTGDACLPRPGVDPRMSALGYSYATTLFGLAPEITAFKGGHLMTGGLLRESAVDEMGHWHSRIEDNEPGKVVMSESVGGVIPYAGTGSVAAHIWNGDDLNDNGLVGSGGGDFTQNPNASLRVVPLPHSGIPGFGIDSMDHAVGIVASMGRVYPQKVFMRKGDPHHKEVDRRNANDDDSKESSFIIESSLMAVDYHKNCPLAMLRSTHDSGICALAYVVPTNHRVENEKPDAKQDEVANRVLPLMHYRPFAKRAAHTPLETIFKHSVVTARAREKLHNRRGVEPKDRLFQHFFDLPVSKGNKELAVSLMIDFFFPNLNGEGKERSGGAQARNVFDLPNNKELVEIGGLIVQPVTVASTRYSSTFSKFGEKILSTNSPKIIDHYKVGPTAHGYRVDEHETRHLFSAPPTAWRIVSNEGNFFSGRGLNNGVPGTGMRESEMYAARLTRSKKPEAFAATVMTGDGVLMYGESAPLLRPMDMPACTLPTNTWFERRDAVNVRSDPGNVDNLKSINNAYAAITGGELQAEINATSRIDKDFNTYAPAKPHYKIHPHLGDISTWFHLLGILDPPVWAAYLYAKAALEIEAKRTNSAGPFHMFVPLKFFVQDTLWQQCKVTTTHGPLFIHPTMSFFESFLRLRTIASESFIRPEWIQNRLRADWGMSPHTAGHYLNGIYSPPCVREETGQAYGYPCSGALNQYMTLLVPKPLGSNSHSLFTKESFKARFDLEMQAISEKRGQLEPSNEPKSENVFDKIGQIGLKEKCNCTCGYFCPRLHGEGRGDAAPITAIPSRGNRHSRFSLMTTIPKNNIFVTAPLLRLQIGDSVMLDLIGRTRLNGRALLLSEAAKGGWGLDVKAMVAPNKWSAFRRNIAYTPYSSRQSRDIAGVFKKDLFNEACLKFDREGYLMGPKGMTDFVDRETLKKDDDALAGVPPHNSEVLNIVENASIPGEAGAKARRLLDFLESVTGAAPSTFNVGTFCPHAEGAKDIVAMYATPIFTSVYTPSTTIREGLGRSTPDNSDSRNEMAVVASSSGNLVMSKRETRDHPNGKRKFIVNLEEDAEIIRTDIFGKAVDDLRQQSLQQPPGTLIHNPHRVDTIQLYEASKNTPRVMRRVHLLPVNTQYQGGFESGQTSTEAACTRGVELVYRDFMKPPMEEGADITTSLEGVRMKAPEPFDDISTRGFRELDSHALRKYAHHHHYGYEALLSRNYQNRDRGTRVPEGELKNRFPFICQSDRGTFPPKRDGTMQPLAMVDMGVISESSTDKTIIL
uniref:Wsv209-like protein n=1 Tax=Metapenaeus ensis nimavirus TaxID=2133794 RepID=A0A401IP92_9VIRU|nr:MAG: wsv209-like protein [Metapenaeus ensis nimavirus]GBG35433.1 wsv209-like protein [Metapenaeus ensis nimavirus]